MESGSSVSVNAPLTGLMPACWMNCSFALLRQTQSSFTDKPLPI